MFGEMQENSHCLVTNEKQFCFGKKQEPVIVNEDITNNYCLASNKKQPLSMNYRTTFSRGKINNSSCLGKINLSLGKYKKTASVLERNEKMDCVR